MVDTGVDLTTDAAPAIVERHSVFGGTTDDVGGSGLAKHGTLVAGVIASQLDGRDSVGIWPQARIVSVRVFAGSGGGTTVAAVITALEKCRERGAKVVNLSISGLDTRDGGRARSSSRTGRRSCAARGTSTWSRAPATTAVRSGIQHASRSVLGGRRESDAAGALCAFSNRGAGLDLFALGCDVELSWPGGGLGAGTARRTRRPSSAASLAALRAYRPRSERDRREELLLLDTASDGRVDAAAAFRAAGLGRLVERSGVDAPPESAVDGRLRRRVWPSVDVLTRCLELGVATAGASRSLYARASLRVRIGSACRTSVARSFASTAGATSRTSGALRLRLRRASATRVGID